MSLNEITLDLFKEWARFSLGEDGEFDTSEDNVLTMLIEAVKDKVKRYISTGADGEVLEINSEIKLACLNQILTWYEERGKQEESEQFTLTMRNYDVSPI